MSIDKFVETKNLELYAKEENCIILSNDVDFDNTFNRVFKEDEPIEDEGEQFPDEEIRKKYYYYQNYYTINEEPSQIIYENHEFKKDKKSKEKSIKEKNVNYIEKKDQIDIKIEIKEDKDDEVKEINIHNEKKIESNNIVNEGKKNIFRTYNSHEYILFHPGGIVDYFKNLKDEIRKESLNPKKKKGKFAQNNLKFNIYKNNKKQKQRRLKEIKNRKDKPDNIRKKIKSRFLKILKTRINEKLKNAKSKLFFDNLPQCFISDISKNGNKFILDMTIKELLTKNFFEDGTSKDNNEKIFIQKKPNPNKEKHEKNPNKEKYEKNQKVLEYLEENSDVRKNSNFNVINKLTFREIFKEYLKSEEFEIDILKLKYKDNSDKYIKDYINKAYNFLDYFSKEN